ncbi:uncharacterized protein LOC113315592 [Papaver somniferum]|uniref:uncharacterized protein LOC113315592 n=1 Tax=Papaver somniferum TaxID=3469 RepID=UPI000E6FA759|nr:uncharacterized protein LOC113315592 [Papaver somniferum]
MPLEALFPENIIMQQNPEMKVADLICDGEWVIPESLLDLFEPSELPVLDGKGDRKIWTEFSVDSAYELRGIVPADDKMKKIKFQLASRCPFCKNSEENLEHILWFCDFSEIIRNWLGGIFSFTNPISFEDILLLAQNKSPAVKEIWKVAALVTLKEIWFMRNRMVYEEEAYKCEALKKRIISFTKESEVRMSSAMWNSAYSLQILKTFELKCRRVKTVKVTEIFFYLHDPSYFLICCDGSSRGNPGAAGHGFIYRKWNGVFEIVVSGGLGTTSNFLAEIFAVICAGEWAVNQYLLRIYFRSDSQPVISAFQTGKIPWWVITRWNKIKSGLQEWYFVHSYREMNTSADLLDKKGVVLAKGERRIYKQCSNFITRLENPDFPYYRFS